MRAVMVILLFVAAAVSIASTSKSEKDKEKKVRKGKVSARVTARGLYAEYKKNEVAADSKYKGKILVVTGKVRKIGKDISDTPYIALKASRVIGSVQCMFAKSRSSELAKVRKGQQISLKGLCEGKMMNVILRGCLIEKTLPAK